MIPSAMDFALRVEPLPYDPAQAKRLLAETGYPSGFDAGDLTPMAPFTTFGEAAANYLAAIGIRTRVRAMERAAFIEAWRSKKLSGLIMSASVIRTSTISFACRRRSATASGARRSCTRSSG